MEIRNILKDNPIIAAAQAENLHSAVKSKACAVLLMYGKLIEILDDNFQVNNKEKPIFIHMDLLKGLSSDSESLKFLNKYVKPAGIVSTKSSVIRSAKKTGLITIQRIFLIDTKSFDNAIDSIKDCNPDAIEIMPGIAPAIIPAFKERISQPIIIGGLISEAEQIHNALKAGADGVSLSAAKLWNLDC
ncbi:glycerol-3-phosphate responsive antiterminator [Desulfosporosinus shakirovi]|uniref:glycerol-3-phosphate responsive antiterminator n=1 Tax=Desulfosporosinus shakirovi TaxID=2885154 RepID=UPI001E63245C|nr:glycerol-3-phosphate responsive antiterminator [Desulfosporosinus sp. SRJS8]MCB8814785.1 glycerol-3-phosphate responsive antiterminator [Desulfosporosinus sp. SRJS8]